MVFWLLCGVGFFLWGIGVVVIDGLCVNFVIDNNVW